MQHCRGHDLCESPGPSTCSSEPPPVTGQKIMAKSYWSNHTGQIILILVSAGPRPPASPGPSTCSSEPRPVTGQKIMAKSYWSNHTGQIILVKSYWSNHTGQTMQHCRGHDLRESPGPSTCSSEPRPCYWSNRTGQIMLVRSSWSNKTGQIMLVKSCWSNHSHTDRFILVKSCNVAVVTSCGGDLGPRPRQ
jgi:hypothetical protein